MKAYKRIFALFTVMLLILSFTACNGASAKDFEYEDVVGGINITSYNGNAKELEIPETINNKKVISISDNALSGNIKLEKLILPKYIDSINAQALEGCDNLKYFEMKSEKASISGSLSEKLSSVSELVLPNAKKVESWNNVFGNLKSVYAPNCINYAVFSDSIEEITIKSTPQIVEYGIINSKNNPFLQEKQDTNQSYDMYYIYGIRAEANDVEFNDSILDVFMKKHTVELNEDNKAKFLCSAFKKNSIKINERVYESEELYPLAY